MIPPVEKFEKRPGMGRSGRRYDKTGPSRARENLGRKRVKKEAKSKAASITVKQAQRWEILKYCARKSTSFLSEKEVLKL
jgi:hypothetical protein